MTRTELLCPDLQAAERNRQRLHETDAYYQETEHQVAQWPLGEVCPKGIRLGELPTLQRSQKANLASQEE